MILYVGSKRYSSWSLRPHLAFEQSGVPYEERTIILDQPDSKANIAKVSPSARVPVLIVPRSSLGSDDHVYGRAGGDLVIQDSLAICEYIAEIAPQLWPSDRATRARARAISAEMHSGFAALRRDMPMDVCAHKPGVGHTAEALADAARVMAIWREALAASGGPFLYGAFSIADAMYAPVTTRFTTYGVETDAVCRTYIATIAELPAMKRYVADAAREPPTRA